MPSCPSTRLRAQAGSIQHTPVDIPSEAMQKLVRQCLSSGQPSVHSVHKLSIFKENSRTYLLIDVKRRSLFFSFQMAFLDLAGWLLQARQQSVEDVNQRWAAKSHTLLSRIANLEHQLQGRSGEGPDPAGQVSHKLCCHGCCLLCCTGTATSTGGCCTAENAVAHAWLPFH